MGTGKTKVQPPKVFHGKREQLCTFLDNLFLFFEANPEAYSSSRACIVTALTYMAGGSVAPWREGVTAAARATGQWGTWDNFECSLYTTFAPIEEAAVAAIKVHHLDFSQFDTIDNFNAKFF